jgi:hypothetical protein
MLSVTQILLQAGVFSGEQILLKLIVAAVVFGLVVAVALYMARGRTRSMEQPGITASKFNVATIPTFRNSADLIAKEFARMRRYDRPLAIVVIRLKSAFDEALPGGRSAGAASVKSDKEADMPNQLSFLLACSLFLDALRESDIATYDPTNNQFILILPESNKSQALLTILRLQDMFAKRTATDLEAGISEFPSDGLITDDLVTRATVDCKPLQSMQAEQTEKGRKIRSERR